MVTLHQRRPRARLFFCFRAAALLALALVLAACGRETESDTGPAVLHWAPMAGATQYTVRAWSGYHLLFEETVSDTSLALTENLQRVLAGADSLVLEVKGLGADEASAGDGEEAVVGHWKRPLSMQAQ